MNFDIANLAISIGQNASNFDLNKFWNTAIATCVGALFAFTLNIINNKLEIRKQNIAQLNIFICRASTVFETLNNIIGDLKKIRIEYNVHKECLNKQTQQVPIFNNIILKFLYRIRYKNNNSALEFVEADNPMLFYRILKIDNFIDTVNNAIDNREIYNEKLLKIINLPIKIDELHSIYENIDEKCKMIEQSNNILLKELYQIITLAKEYGIKKYGIRKIHKFTVKDELKNVIDTLIQQEGENDL